eukprot:TRINITY_DN8763_c0_g1_i1.p2 TRINITY_DN8763_c0_g1~~TRINITY_DN8763_c0_g1_i1.p2  ORF type:complete len:305 (+),score=78.55 TRINITY_DN8763_c0_g1_i1:101-1015(+)
MEFEFDPDFEELKEGESVPVHLIAGAVAGVAEHCGMFPVDTIRTNMQALLPGSSATASAVRTAQTLVHQHGVGSLFRGLGAMAAGAAPAHAMHFAVYEFLKGSLVGSRHEYHPIRVGFAGICATAVSDAVMTPMDAVKQRMQLNVRHYRNTIDCMRTVVRTEGVSALYAGYTTTLIMNIPFNTVYFATYEGLRLVLKRGTESEFDARAHIIAGCGAGSMAAAITNPFDVVKTRLQTQGDVGKHYKGMLDTIQTIYAEEGWAGFMRGWKPRVAQHSMSAALLWLTYEYVKNVLNPYFAPPTNRPD